jgi:hypothetical protein
MNLQNLFLHYTDLQNIAAKNYIKSFTVQVNITDISVSMFDFHSFVLTLHHVQFT